MNASPELIEFLKGWEGPPHFAPREDPVSPGTWDIGYGHVCPRTWLPITPEDAERFLSEDVERFADAVRKLVGLNLLQHEFDALTSFALNLGRGALAGSTLLRFVNTGDMASAADQFRRWNQAGGRVVAGLVKRRAAERAMFVDNDYSARP